MLDRMPERLSDRMPGPKNMSDRMPEKLSDRMSKNCRVYFQMVCQKLFQNSASRFCDHSKNFGMEVFNRGLFSWRKHVGLTVISVHHSPSNRIEHG